MAEKAEDLTPEEKLLKVIQEDRSGQESVSVQEPVPVIDAVAAAAAAPVTVEEPAARPGGKPKPKLKLAKIEEPVTEAAGRDVAADQVVSEAPEVKKGAAGAGTMAVSHAPRWKAPRGSGFGIAAANRCLAVVVLIMVGFTAYEIWASIKMPASEGSGQDASPDGVWIDRAPDYNLPPLDDVLKAFVQNPVIGARAQQQELPVTGTPDPTPRPTPIEVYAKENLNLIGISSGEAIILDRKVNKMYFLKVDDTMTVEGTELKLVEITAEYADVSYGEKVIRIE